MPALRVPRRKVPYQCISGGLGVDLDDDDGRSLSQREQEEGHGAFRKPFPSVRRGSPRAYNNPKNRWGPRVSRLHQGVTPKWPR